MLAMAIRRGIARAGYFWSKKPPKKSEQEQIEEHIQNSPNLGYIIEQIRKKNEGKPFLLPPQAPQYKNKLTVVLQLDEVLSYTFTPDEEGYLLAPLRKHDFYTEYDEYNACLSIYKRKNLDNFLSYLAEECEPVLWSAGVQGYVDIVMGLIDPHKKIPYILTQNCCDLVENKEEDLDLFLKDLNLLGRDMARVVYIDSKPLSYWICPKNCLPIEDFRADMTMEGEDLNLMILELEDLKKKQDVRQNLNQRFHIFETLKSAHYL